MICLLLVLAASLGRSLTQPTVYEAKARVLLDTGFSRTVLFSSATNIPDLDEQVTTEADLMRTSLVQEGIRKRLGYLPDVNIQTDRMTSSSATDQAKTRTIFVVAQGPTAALAVKSADDYAKTYIPVRKAEISEDLRAKIADNDRALSNLDVSTARANDEIARLGVMIKSSTGENQRILEARRDRLIARTSSAAVNARQIDILTRQDALQTALINNEGQGIFKRSPAEPPTSPITPRPVRDLSIALLIGLGLGLIAAFLRDYYDDTLRTKEDLTRIAGNPRVLGIIPRVKPWKNKNEAVLESIVRPGSIPAEAYRGLRTALEFSGIGRDMRVIHVTSSEPGEGKSTTAANLAVTLARSGHDVVLVDCDLRRPRAHKFFDLDNSVGFTTLLLGTTSVEESLHRIPDVPGLFVVPSGPLPPNPSELLDNSVARSRFELLAKSADYVIVDSPPLLPVADSIIIAGYSHATILVVMARVARRRSVKRSLELLAQVDLPAFGVVLNGVGTEGTYGYGYGYDQEEDPRFDPRLWRRSREVIQSGQQDLPPAEPKDDSTAPRKPSRSIVTGEKAGS